MGQCDPHIFTWLSHATNPPRSKASDGSFGGGGLGGGLGIPTIAVLDRRKVGVYDVSVVVANDSGALLRWLNGNGYHTARRLTSIINDYIRQGFVFTAMRIDPFLKPKSESPVTKPEETESVKPSPAAPIVSSGLLEPIRLTFYTPKPVFPLKISSMNGGSTFLLIYLMTPQPVTDVGLSREFIARMKPSDLNGITRGNPRIYSAKWLTKVSATFKSSNMTEDLHFGYRHPGALDPIGSTGQ